MWVQAAKCGLWVAGAFCSWGSAGPPGLASSAHCVPTARHLLHLELQPRPRRADSSPGFLPSSPLLTGRVTVFAQFSLHSMEPMPSGYRAAGFQTGWGKEGKAGEPQAGSCRLQWFLPEALESRRFFKKNQPFSISCLSPFWFYTCVVFFFCRERWLTSSPYHGQLSTPPNTPVFILEWLKYLKPTHKG